MDIKFLLLTGAVAAGSFAVGMVSMGRFPTIDLSLPDPAVFNYSKDQVQTMLVNARTTLPRRDGPDRIEIWGAGRSSKGVTLNMKYASWAPLLSCEAVVTPIAADKSRVVANCAATAASESAIGHTQDSLRTPMFAEHIQATLNKRAFNRANVDAQETAIVFKNIGGMQREALKRADEAAAASSQMSR